MGEERRLMPHDLVEEMDEDCKARKKLLLYRLNIKKLIALPSLFLPYQLLRLNAEILMEHSTYFQVTQDYFYSVPISLFVIW